MNATLQAQLLQTHLNMYYRLLQVIQVLLPLKLLAMLV